MRNECNYNDLTFIIPIRIDSIIRLENLMTVLKCLKKLNSKVIVIEANKYNNNIVQHILPRSLNIKYLFIEDDDVVFYRTHFINEAMKLVSTSFVAVWDADVVVDNQQIEESMQALRGGYYEISFPYNGDFLNTDYVLRQKFMEHVNIDLLVKYRCYMNQLYGKDFIGGGFIMDKEKYLLAGGENENFYGWGPEDADRVLRWENIEYKTHRSKGCMFHLCHPRDINGSMRTSIYYSLCQYYLSNSRYSSKYEIINNTNKIKQ